MCQALVTPELGVSVTQSPTAAFEIGTVLVPILPREAQKPDQDHTAEDGVGTEARRCDP